MFGVVVSRVGILDPYYCDSATIGAVAQQFALFNLIGQSEFKRVLVCPNDPVLGNAQ